MERNYKTNLHGADITFNYGVKAKKIKNWECLQEKSKLLSPGFCEEM